MNRKAFLGGVFLVFFCLVFSSPSLWSEIKFTGNHFTVGNLRDIAEGGDRVYAISDDYLFIWEKPSPTSPSREIRLCSATRVNAQAVPFNQLRQIVYRDGRVYIRLDWHVMAYDVLDPKNPKFLSRYPSDNYTGAIEAYGDLVYLGCSGGHLYVLSYANPENPVQVNHVQLPLSFPAGLYEVRGYLLATYPNWSGFQTDVYSLADPVNPVHETSAPYIFHVDNLIGNYLYGHGRYYDGSNWVQILRKIDAATLPVLTVVGSAVFDENFEGVGFDGQNAYVMRAHKQDAIYVSPSTVEEWSMGDWSNPRLMRTAEAESSIHDCVCDGRFVYAADGIRGLKAYPAGPAGSIEWQPRVNRFLLEPVDILRYGDYSFYVCENRWPDSETIIAPQSEINILDTHDLLAPKLVATIREARIVKVSDAKIWQDHLYILKDANYGQEEGALSVYKIVPGGAPALEPVAVHKVDNDMCLAFYKDTMMVTGLFTDVDFYDIRDPARIEHLSTYRLPIQWPCYWEGVVDVLDRGIYYLPWGTDAGGSIHGYGVKVLDISDPRNPHAVQDAPFEFGKMEIAQQEYYLYSAHWRNVTVIDVHRPEMARIANDYTVPMLVYLWVAATSDDTLLLSGERPVGNFYQPCIIRADISRPPEIGQMELVDSQQEVLDLVVPEREILYSVESDNLSVYAFTLGP
jgi:hypothetical protein